MPFYWTVHTLGVVALALVKNAPATLFTAAALTICDNVLANTIDDAALVPVD